MTGTATLLSEQLDTLIEEETQTFVRRQPESRAFTARAGHLAGGATSNWQIAEPQAVWISHGLGSKIYDVDGCEYSDFHGGYGVSLAGHAHPAIVAAVQGRVRRGTHFAQPTEDAIIVADNLADRFGLPLWRFGNSGTEATMDAVHLMRAATGRDRILKVEGCYHGHHDSVLVSVLPEPDDDIGPPDRPVGVPDNTGIPQAIMDLVTVVPFNDLAAVERALLEHPDQVAGMILEPIMMNAGIIHPVDGYLVGLKELLHQHGALLAFDEVKTGLTVGPAGASGMFGVTPDLLCLAKAMGGGVSTAAIGGTESVMSLIADGGYEQVGTFNGNPLAMASARAMLTEVLTPASYAHLDRLRERIATGIEAVIERHGLPWRVVTAGAKGCVSFLPHPIRNFRDFQELDGRYGHAHWLVQHNRGAFLPPWGKVEQWLMSVQHTDDDVDRFVANCDHLARRLLGAA
jgi:glutamate-1-semialdehyde 2,1-aminomutase